jgi:hypothetical protein
VLGATYGERFMCLGECNEFISDLVVVVREDASAIEDLSICSFESSFF